MTRDIVANCTHCSKSSLRGFANCHSCGVPFARAREITLRSPLLGKGYDEIAIANRLSDKEIREEFIRIPTTDIMYISFFGFAVLVSIVFSFLLNTSGDASLSVFFFILLPSIFCLFIHREIYGPVPLRSESRSVFLFLLKAVLLFTVLVICGSFVGLEWYAISTGIIGVWLLTLSLWQQKKMESISYLDL